MKFTIIVNCNSFIALFQTLALTNFFSFFCHITEIVNIRATIGLVGDPLCICVMTNDFGCLISLLTTKLKLLYVVDHEFFLFLQEQRGKDEVTLNEPDLEKPEKPKPATVDDARQKVIDKYNNIRRLPGLLLCCVWKLLQYNLCALALTQLTCMDGLSWFLEWKVSSQSRCIVFQVSLKLEYFSVKSHINLGLISTFCRVMLCKRGLCHHAVSVHVYVCVSVTFVNYVKKNKHIKIFSPLGSHTILVSPCQMA